MKKIVWKRLITSLILISIILPLGNFLQINEVRDRDYPIVSSTSDSWSLIVKAEEFKQVEPKCEVINGSLYFIGVPKARSYLYIICFNITGNKEWELSFKIVNPLFYYIFDSDNNLTILYNYHPFSNNISLIKLNPLGVVLFSKEYNLGLDINEAFLVLGENNSLLFVGIDYFVHRCLFIMKFNKMGQYLWSTSFNIDGHYISPNIISDSNNNIYLSFLNNSVNYLAKINGSGEISWQIGLSDTIPEKLMIDVNNTLYVIGSKELHTSILKINNTGTILKEIILDEFYSYNFHLSWFLEDGIGIMIADYGTNSLLYYYDLNLNLQWNFSLTGYVSFLLPYYNTHEIIAKYMQENIHVLGTYLGHISLLKINKTGNLISKIDWGGSYILDPRSLIIDSENNIYFFSNCGYYSRWDIWYGYAILVKNPVNGGTPPQLRSNLEMYDYFLFSLIGISCIISLITVISILKSKKEDEKRIV